MIQHLDPGEARVLGCLIEKQMTTPEYYPMTVNALVAAASQKTNRDPVMTYDEEMVEGALASLNERELSRFTRTAGARTLKYVHKADDILQVDPQQLAIIAVMLLRGPQTPGELRSRTDRYVSFDSVAEVEEVLSDLMTRDEPLVERLDRVPGQKEHRYRTLLTEHDASATPAAASAPSSGAPVELVSRIEDLERRVAFLERSLGVEAE
jgi:uncharacterized protein YceH (UPF0502 family)